MIQLQKQINSAKIQQINLQRIRKSSRLLHAPLHHKDYYSSIQIVNQGDIDKSVELKPPRYTQLMKLLRKPHQQDKEAYVTKSVDYSHLKGNKIDTHFKGEWRPQLQSEMIVSPCKEDKRIKRSLFQPRVKREVYQNRQYQTKIKQKQSKFKSFKIHSVHFFSRQQIHHQRASFIKYELKIEQPLSKQHTSQQRPIEIPKQKITLQPLKKVYEKLKNITPPKQRKSPLQKAKQAQKNLESSISHHAQKIVRKRPKKPQVFSSKKKANHLSAWTFHNIQQQIL